MVQMSFIIMYNFATAIDILVWVSLYYFARFGLKMTLRYIQVRYCHLLGIWYVFIVDMLFSSFFDSAHDKIDVYLKISFIYTSDLII